MKRRTALRALGSAATVGVGIGMAGCLGGSHEAANEFGYETTPNDGVEVPLVPLEDAVEWYNGDDDVLYVDTRDQTAFDRARIKDAVLSPAPDGQEQDDPVRHADKETRIVTYCVCPHHLATLRGASLIRNGYVHTYAIDEGFEPWVEGGHPVEGSQVGDRPDVYRIDGRTDAAYAGDLAWARHESTGQREAVPIDADGAFTLHLRFHDIDVDAEIELETPGGRVTGPLATFLDDPVELD